MSSCLRSRISQLDGATIVTAVGVLDRTSCSELRTVLLKCLADQPAALVADLTEVVVAEPAALTVVAAVARQASIWPALPFVVTAPSGPVVTSLRRLGIDRAVPVRETPVQALDCVDGALLPTMREFLPPLPGAERRARIVTADTCVRWGLDHLSDQACIVVSELVSNVIRHAGTTMQLRLSRRDRYLLMAVEDGVPTDTPLAPLAPRPDKDAALGLLLVDRIAYRWGSMPTSSGGKVVWAVLHLANSWPEG